MAKARFLIQTRFPAERRWRTYKPCSRVDIALAEAGALAAAVQEEGRRRFFPNVRITFRGFTLHRWQNGYVR